MRDVSFAERKLADLQLEHVEAWLLVGANVAALPSNGLVASAAEGLGALTCSV